MEWKVYYYDFNRKKIQVFNVFDHPWFYEDIKTKKKNSTDKENFFRSLKTSVRYYFWSKFEWELIIKLEEGRILLYPFVSSQNLEITPCDITSSDLMDWDSFAKYHIDKQIFGNEAKIDVSDQIFFQWDTFSEKVWKEL